MAANYSGMSHSRRMQAVRPANLESEKPCNIRPGVQKRVFDTFSGTLIVTSKSAEFSRGVLANLVSMPCRSPRPACPDSAAIMAGLLPFMEASEGFGFLVFSRERVRRPLPSLLTCLGRIRRTAWEESMRVELISVGTLQSCPQPPNSAGLIQTNNRVRALRPSAGGSSPAKARRWDSH